MAIALLKNVTKKANINEQQKAILKYAKNGQISIKSTEIEVSDLNLPLMQRKEFKGFLRSLSNNEHVLVFDTWVLSLNVVDLIKICECLLDRNITLHICNLQILISNSTKSLEILKFLSRNIQNKQACQSSKKGRPKGRMSRSKFDLHRVRIIEMLEFGQNVSKIAQELNLSRSSLKDYINSRGLKELADVKKSLADAVATNIKSKNFGEKECDLIKDIIEGERNV